MLDLPTLQSSMTKKYINYFASTQFQAKGLSFPSGWKSGFKMADMIREKPTE
jgi:hypothetical protein